MNHQRMYGDPRSNPQDDRRRGIDPWEGRQGEAEGYRGGSYENAGYHGGGTRTYEGGGYANAAHTGHYPDGGYAGDPQMSDYPGGDDRRGRSDDRRRPGTGSSSTYGGLGGGAPYGTHGWTRRGDGYDVDDRQFDADYRQWREQQMREFDRDYEQWRLERYKKFSEEFDQWRASRRS